MPQLRLFPKTAALAVIDVQEKLWPVMEDAETRARVLRNLLLLVEAARRLGLPILWSEQYPRGLGPTIPELAAALSAPGLDVHRLEKMEFSCTAAPAFADIAARLGPRTWIVAGIETHVCVYQTVRDLTADGAPVHIVADAVSSRTAANRAVGLDLAARAGAVVTSTEVAVFDLLHRAGSEDFKALSRLVK
jgi:nicotinamidase-related amidase